MSGIDLSNFGNLVSNLGGLMPTGNQIVENVLLGAASNVVLKGLSGSGLLPIPIPGQSANNNPNVVAGPTITASAYAVLPASAQAQLMAAGVHIVAG